MAVNGYFFLQFGFHADRHDPPQGDSGAAEMAVVAPQHDDRGDPYRW